MTDGEHQRAELTALGRAVRRMREDRDVSTDELAEATGVTRERIGALEAGRVDPGYDMLVALAMALRTQPSALIALAEDLTDRRES